MKSKLVIISPENYGLSVLVSLGYKYNVDSIAYSIFDFREKTIGSFKTRFYLTWPIRKWKLKRLGFKLEKLPVRGVKKFEVSDDVLESLRKVFLRVCQDHFVFVNCRFPSKQELNASINDREWLEFIEAYKALKEYIVENEFTDLFVFNGRPLILKLLEFVCKHEHVTFHISEILGGSANGLTYFSSDVSFWNFQNFSFEIMRYYQAAISNLGANTVNAIAENYYIRRKRGEDFYLSKWINSTAWQSVRNKNKKVCTFFFSSIDELPAFDAIETEINYLDQISLIKDIAELIRKDFVDYSFKVKVHPRMISERKLKYFLRDVLHSDLNGAEIVPMDLNPYALIESSDVVCASVSSIAWEATFAGKCAVVFGGTWAMTHDAHHIVRTWDGFRNILKNPTVKDSHNALPVAYFIETAGHPYLKHL